MRGILVFLVKFQAESLNVRNIERDTKIVVFFKKITTTLGELEKVNQPELLQQKMAVNMYSTSVRSEGKRDKFDLYSFWISSK